MTAKCHGTDYGYICHLAKLCRHYRGKRHPISREAALSMGRSAKRGESFAHLSMRVQA